jgi:hypothetical protein
MGEIRAIDYDCDLDVPPVERVSRMLAKGYLYGSHFTSLENSSVSSMRFAPEANLTTPQKYVLSPLDSLLLV